MFKMYICKDCGNSSHWFNPSDDVICSCYCECRNVVVVDRDSKCCGENAGCDDCENGSVLCEDDDYQHADNCLKYFGGGCDCRNVPLFIPKENVKPSPNPVNKQEQSMDTRNTWDGRCACYCGCKAISTNGEPCNFKDCNGKPSCYACSNGVHLVAEIADVCDVGSYECKCACTYCNPEVKCCGDCEPTSNKNEELK